MFLSCQAFVFLNCHLAIQLSLLWASQPPFVVMPILDYYIEVIILGYSFKRITYRLYFNNFN